MTTKTTPVLAKRFTRTGLTTAPLVLRLGVGIIMLAHGVEKLRGGVADGTGAWFESLGIPAPVAMAWVVTVIEVVGGVMLVAGLFTRLVALLFIAVMIGAIGYVGADGGFATGADGPGADLQVALIAGALALILMGPGRYAVDSRLGIDR